MSAWCDRCLVGSARCGIPVESMRHDVDEFGYPPEWVRDAAGPRCTVFEAKPWRAGS